MRALHGTFVIAAPRDGHLFDAVAPWRGTGRVEPGHDTAGSVP